MRIRREEKWGKNIVDSGWSDKNLEKRNGREKERKEKIIIN